MRPESREQYNSQDEAWTKAQKEVDAIVDKLGKRVDPGIKESVIVLRVLGLNTDGSCEGHLDRSLKAPYIDVGQVPQDFSRRFDAAWKSARERGEKRIDPAIEAEAKEVLMKLRSEQSRLLDLLEEFYRDREVPLRRRLVLNFFGNTARLISQEGQLQDIYPEEVQRRKLGEFQEEMGLFTAFLKRKFVS